MILPISVENSEIYHRQVFRNLNNNHFSNINNTYITQI